MKRGIKQKQNVTPQLSMITLLPDVHEKNDRNCQETVMTAEIQL